MTSLQRELCQCLQYLGPMTSDQILEKMNLRPRLEQLTLIEPELIALSEHSGVPQYATLRVSKGIYACNRAIGDL